MLKKVLIIIMLVVALLISGCMTTYDLSHATTLKTGITKTITKANLTLAKEYCQKYCNGYKIKVVKCVPTNRNDSEHVYIEKVSTVSKGGYQGKTNDGYIVKYNKKVKKGKRVTMYLVYNPSNNVFDDVICKVCNHIVIGDKEYITGGGKRTSPQKI